MRTQPIGDDRGPLTRQWVFEICLYPNASFATLQLDIMLQADLQAPWRTTKMHAHLTGNLVDQ